MNAHVTLLGALDALFFFGGMLSLIVLPGWLQKRHRETARRQIAITEALDAEFGQMVAPVVTKPIGRAWRIEISIPLGRTDAAGHIVETVDHVLSVMDGVAPSRYRILLTPKADPAGETSGFGAERRPGRLAGRPAAA